MFFVMENLSLKLSLGEYGRYGTKVPKLPSARNTIISSTFLTAESFGICLNNLNNRHYYNSIRNTWLVLCKKQFVYL